MGDYISPYVSDGEYRARVTERLKSERSEVDKLRYELEHERPVSPYASDGEYRARVIERLDKSKRLDELEGIKKK